VVAPDTWSERMPNFWN